MGDCRHCDDREREMAALQDSLQSAKVERNELQVQIGRLAGYILGRIPGYPNKSEGACDTAIQVMEDQKVGCEQQIAALQAQLQAAEAAEAAAGRETPPPETQQKPHHWTFREATSLEGSRDATRFAGAFYDATGAKLSLIGTKDAKRIEAWLNAPTTSEEG